MPEPSVSFEQGKHALYLSHSDHLSQWIWVIRAAMDR